MHSYPVCRPPVFSKTRAPPAQEDGNNVDLHFINQAGPKVFLDDVDAAPEGDVFAVRRLAGSLVTRGFLR
jgi:hypothetical protein